MPVAVMSAVIALLLSLPERTFRVVALRHQKKTFVEIAAEVDASVAAVEVSLRRAMRKHPELKALFQLKAAKAERRKGKAKGK